MNFKNTWILDLETYRNLFVLVANSLEDESIYHKFAVGDAVDDYNLIMEFLKTHPTLVTFNGLSFDGQVLELLWRSPKRVSPAEICDFIDQMFEKRKENRFYSPVSEWDLSFPQIDVLKLNHLDNPAKMTSLKWLEYTMRLPSMKDLPFPVDALIPASSVSKVISYCKLDCDATKAFFKRCLPIIELRLELAEKYHNPRLINLPDSSIGEFIIKDALKRKGIKESDLKKTVPRKTINIGEIILDYVYFRGETFNTVLENYRNMVVQNTKEEGLTGITSQTVDFKGIPIDFALGGLHGCTRSGVYLADEEYTIATIDCKSYYPFLSIINRFAPAHLGQRFCEVYKELYEERTKYAKGTALNFAYKIALNGTYGKTNNPYSFLYDPQMTLQVTINGQLLLAMLVEELSELGEVLVINTDGLEISLPRKRMDEMKEVCKAWEELTGLELEYGAYSKLILKDVNNYIAISENGSAKRKGLFQVYDDYTEKNGSEHSYHGAPNGTIIPEALFKYYTENIPVEQTISECETIYPFLYGVKTRKNFEFWLIQAQEDGVVDIETRNERAVRFYVKKKGANMFKYWLDGRKTKLVSVKRGELVETAMDIKRGGALRTFKKQKGLPSVVINNYEPNLDFYTRCCYKIMQEIEEGVTTDSSTVIDGSSNDE